MAFFCSCCTESWLLRNSLWVDVKVKWLARKIDFETLEVKFSPVSGPTKAFYYGSNMNMFVWLASCVWQLWVMLCVTTVSDVVCDNCEWCVRQLWVMLCVTTVSDVVCDNCEWCVWQLWVMLCEAGWQPRRTIIFAHWDAGDLGQLGSYEWVEVLICCCFNVCEYAVSSVRLVDIQNCYLLTILESMKAVWHDNVMTIVSMSDCFNWL